MLTTPIYGGRALESWEMSLVGSRIEEVLAVWQQLKASPNPERVDVLKQEAHNLMEELSKIAPPLYATLRSALKLKPFEQATPEQIATGLDKLNQSDLDELTQRFSLFIEMSRRDGRRHQKGDPAMLSR